MYSMVIKTESRPIEEPEAVIPMDIVGSGSPGPAMLGGQSIEEPEAIIPMEIVSSGSPTIATTTTTTTTTTVGLRRKAARRTESWHLPPPPRRGTRERQLPKYFASPPPQAEDIPARKKPRLEESQPTTRARTSDEAARKTPSPEISVEPPPPADDADDDANTDADPVTTDTQSNDGATPVTGRWTLEEDAKLTSAVTHTRKKKYSKEYKTDWIAISALVPGRTNSQCRTRWHDVSNTSIDQASGRKGKWTEDEDSKLKDAVKAHGGKDWIAIATLVPGRVEKQCRNRWHDFLDPSIDRSNERTGSWTAVEDSKLKDAIQTHGGKNWGLISALVPGRTKKQCWGRWRDALDPGIDRANGRTGRWTAVEDSKLKDAVQTHGGKDWIAIAALVPGRTKLQCNNRWKYTLNPRIDRTTRCTGKWSEDEDSKLKDAVQTQELECNFRAGPESNEKAML
jgi:hypothetical protein